HRPTAALEHETGQVGELPAHVGFACAAMKVVVEVDVELGLTRVVWIGTAQDVGKAINPQAVEGQIEGGTAQGLGLALMEEIQTRDGLIANASFTDYLIPTALDVPPIVSALVEDPEPDAPYGLKGVGEPPTVVSTAALVAALRDATAPSRSRRPRGGAPAERRPRGPHGPHPPARQGFLCRKGRGGPLRRPLREAPIGGPLRVRVAPHRPLDRLPMERPAGRRRYGC